MTEIETTEKGKPATYNRAPITYQEYEDALKELFGKNYIDELNTKSFDEEILNSEIFDAVNSEIAEAAEEGLFTRVCKLLSVRDFIRHVFLIQKETLQEERAQALKERMGLIEELNDDRR